ncbi:hypothetical protein OROGR_018794 [Orobanche gracilis]
MVVVAAEEASAVTRTAIFSVKFGANFLMLSERRVCEIFKIVDYGVEAGGVCFCAYESNWPAKDVAV